MGGNYIREGRDSNKSTVLVFSPKTPDEAGALARFLSIFSSHKVNLSHIESRSSMRQPGYEFMVECEHGAGDFATALDQLRRRAGYLNIISRNHKDNRSVGQPKHMPIYNRVVVELQGLVSSAVTDEARRDRGRARASATGWPS
ncbi:Protein henna [Eumeta japonica]|uniref:Protein henna n=1 Tax=Eumeta variegata TaxID=151549 RepID=A0A4C2A3W6_EUMVA|nr:Protein henna [Eumeta japonica]